IKKAKRSKTAVVSIVRCNHIGRLGQWASQAAAEDVIAMVVTGGSGGSPGRMGRGAGAPFGGAEPAFSTNPISIGMPGGENARMPIHFATTAVAEYEQNADFVLNRVKGIRPAQGFSRVMVPGEPELDSKEARLKEGIPVADATWSQIVEAGKSVGVDVEEVAKV